MENKTPQQQAELVGSWFGKIDPLEKEFIASRVLIYYTTSFEETKTPVTDFASLLIRHDDIERVIGSITAVATFMLSSDQTTPDAVTLDEFTARLIELPGLFSAVERFWGMVPGADDYEKIAYHYNALVQVKTTWFDLLDNELY
jgi:hypothetical protein